MNYYEKHIGDYVRDTAHLSLLEHGIYNRLIDIYYSREVPIPEDQAARLIGARAPEEREALQAVLTEFFERTPEGWRQKRCDAEIERFHDKQDKARKSAEARWSRPQKGARTADDVPTDSDRNADAMRLHMERNALQSPVTSNQTPEDQKTDASDKTTGIRSDPSAPTPEMPVKRGKAKSAGIPCPAQRIADVWDAALPEFAIPLWTERRANRVSCRWREMSEAEKWKTQEEGIAWFRDLIAGCRRSRFLMGKVPPRDRNGLPFRLRFDWFFGPENFVKVVEGEYHRER